MTTAIIPSRFGSARFKGKPLAQISGKPMIQRVYEQAVKSESISKVIIATDNQQIFDTVKSFNGEVVMTSATLRSGTDRVAEAASILGLNPDEIVVNIQGDQPVFNSKVLNELILPFETNNDIEMATLAFKIRNKEEITNPKDVKVIFDKNNFAIYFSRAQIPYPRDNDVEPDYYKHLGFYAYKKSFLDKISNLDSGEYENIEKLEQLRVLESGFKIKISITEYDAPGVDIPDDIKKIEHYLKNHLS
ncbi:MAG: 3-deoxy-manno-octulosonate cytidylyltransferase [Desulfobacteraceae bacterium]|nr:3-deoxy-manno-octulosonate cytidylyltransferase [Desulfobacteraceae bacterium]